MRKRSRRRRFSAMSLWFVVAISLGTVAVWKFGWLPVEFGTAETGTLADGAKGSGTTGRPVSEGGESPDSADAATIHIDPIIFNAQSEPPAEGTISESGEFAGRLPRQQANRPVRPLAAKPWDDPAAPSLPPHFPAVATPAKQPGEIAIGDAAVTSANTGREIVQVVNEVEQPGQGNSDPANHKPALPVKAPAVSATRPNGEQAPAQAAASGESAFDLAAIDRMIEAGDDVAAHRELSKQYWNHPETRSAIQSRIDKTARSIYFAPLPHYMDPYVIQPGDQLRTIAKQYSVPWEYLAKLNQLDPRRIRSGQKLKVLKGPFSAVVDLGAFELTVHAHGYYVRRYLVGIGEDGRSPVGRFTVLNKVVDPQYTDPNGRVIASDDPNNPLGERWIDIGDGFGIHGTIDPESIGKAESRGCVRMHNSDVEELFDLLEIGSEVLIRR